MAFDPTKMFLPHVDEAGHKVGQSLPDLAKGLAKGLAKRLGLGDAVDKLPSELIKHLPNFVKMIAGGLTVNRDRIPFAGKMGDVVHEYLNELIDSVGRGAADKLGGGGDKLPSDGASGPPAKGVTLKMGYVIEGIWYPGNCTHAKRPFHGKGQKGPDDISIEEALKRGHGWCERGCVMHAELETAKAALAAPVDAQPVEPKVQTQPESPAPSADHTVTDLFQSWSTDDPQACDRTWRAYRVRCEDDPKLEPKVQRAFHRHGTYQQFKFVFEHPHTDWHVLLDGLIGKPLVEKGIFQKLKDFLNETFGEIGSKERQQTDEMIDNCGDMLDGAAQKAGDFEKKLDAGIARRRKERETRRASRSVPFLRRFAALLLGPALIFILYLVLINL